MDRPLLRFLVDAAIGLVLALIVSATRGLFRADSAAMAFMCLSDGFFAAGALLLAGGGLQWTYNGGVMDGLGFTFKSGLARVRRNYDDSRVTFAQYRQQREAKATSPKSLLLSGLLYLAIAFVFFGIYYAL